MSWGVIAAVVAIFIVVGAIFASLPPQSIRGITLVVLTNIAFLTV
jgi:hypothetical protein